MHINIDKFSRPVLRFSIRPRTEGEAISVYVAHLKSKSPAEIWREGWYRSDTDFHNPPYGRGFALRMLIVEELKGTDRPLVVIGDSTTGN